MKQVVGPNDRPFPLWQAILELVRRQRVPARVRRAKQVEPSVGGREPVVREGETTVFLHRRGVVDDRRVPLRPLRYRHVDGQNIESSRR